MRYLRLAAGRTYQNVTAYEVRTLRSTEYSSDQSHDLSTIAVRYYGVHGMMVPKPFHGCGKLERKLQLGRKLDFTSAPPQSSRVPYFAFY